MSICQYADEPHSKAAMKLESLHIQNYKLFKDLEISKLGRVNLITGKNNTGKTILLEALRIWASEGDASVVNNIIWKRGDWDEGSEEKTYKSLFNFFEEQGYNKFKINLLWIKSQFEKTHANSRNSYFKSLLVYFLNKVVKEKFDSKKKEMGGYFDESDFLETNAKVLREVKFSIGNKEHPQDKAIFVPASIEFDNKKLWAGIDLTDKKDIVIQILQVIEPSIIDLGIIDNVARVRTKDSKIPVPLKNFGEGLNRLLTIAMALVSAEDNLLLIDEIDTGLHHSVLEKLWEIIFEYAEKLNAQVFVTTHSGDCVDAFAAVTNQERFKGLGNYFRLQRKRNSDEIVPVFYDENELEIAVEQDIETR